ncbi:TPA: hypothetical protein L4F58_005532 [Pseudomonas aeruginosa]|nr:hypothetical protein [Pseudomonas aeruginosa]
MVRVGQLQQLHGGNQLGLVVEGEGDEMAFVVVEPTAAEPDGADVFLAQALAILLDLLELVNSNSEVTHLGV